MAAATFGPPHAVPWHFSGTAVIGIVTGTEGTMSQAARGVPGSVHGVFPGLDEEYAKILALLDQNIAIKHIVESVPRLTGVDLAYVGELDPDGGLILRDAVNSITGNVDGLVVPLGVGLGGTVLASRRPMWVSDYCRAPQITHDFSAHVEAERVKGMIAVPIIHEERLLGVLFGANRQEVEFGGRTAQALEQIAARAATATVVAERARHATEVAVHEERRRMALELHDTLGAMLYTIGAGIRRLGEDVATYSPSSEISERIQSIETQAMEASAALRGSLRVLSAPPEQVALGVALREDVRAFEERTGVKARVLMLTEVPALPESRTRALSDVTREALRNVEKHASAQSVVVSVFASDDGVAVTISDDGVGLPDNYAECGGLGLASTADRLARLGGRATITESEDGGVSVQAWIPR